MLCDVYPVKYSSILGNLDFWITPLVSIPELSEPIFNGLGAVAAFSS